MTAPELSAEEAAIVARFDAAETPPEVQRLVDARESVHARLCGSVPVHSSAECRTVPPFEPLAATLEHLDERPRDARGARWILHDAACASGCQRDSDHADRTQAAEVAAIRKFRATEAAR